MITTSMLNERIKENPTYTILRNDSNEIKKEYDSSPTYNVKYISDLPEEFDGRKVWDGLLSPVLNQGNCGSCWAFASVSTLADRFNIQSLGLYNIRLSPTRLILCNYQGKEFDIFLGKVDLLELESLNKKNYKSSSCYGGTLLDAFRYLYIIGTTTEECLPYNKSLGGLLSRKEIGKFSKVSDLPLCANITGQLSDMCHDNTYNNKTGIEEGTFARYYRCYHYYVINGTPENNSNESDIRINIYKWGPVASGIVIYPDFYSFNGKGVYRWNGIGEKIGGHAIEIVGWGDYYENSKKIPYWLIKNSWGDKWGDKGYFKIARGINECKIEENCITCVPDYFFPLGTIVGFEKDWVENEELKNQRYNISTLIDIKAGGIDPTTGYSRRAIITDPTLELLPPVPIEDLPKWNKDFIAGISANKVNSQKYIKMIKSKYINKYNINIYYILLIVFIILIILSIWILIIKSKKY